MCDPARKEEQGRGCGKVSWRGVPGSMPKIHAHVIESHEDHHQPAQKVDGCDSSVGRSCFGVTNSHEFLTLNGFKTIHAVMLRRVDFVWHLFMNRLRTLELPKFCARAVTAICLEIQLVIVYSQISGI